jgi:hypothetical protein
MSNVPNTTTFTLQNVTQAVYNDTAAGRNLTQAFTDATGTFDPLYVGTKTNLLNFRNYQATYSLTIYGSMPTGANDTSYDINYNTNGGSTYGYAATVSLTACNNMLTITGIAAGTTVYFQLIGSSSGAQIQYRAINTSTCPTSGTLYCNTPGVSSGYSIVIAANTTIAVKPTLNGSNNFILC